MSVSKRRSGGLSPQLTITIVAVAISCVGISIYQAGGFLASLAPDEQTRPIYYMAAAALLIGSLVLSRLSGALSSAGVATWVMCACLVTAAMVEAFSVSTSMSGFDSRMTGAAREQNVASPEYQAALVQVQTIARAIQDEQAAVAAMPASWITRKQQAGIQIQSLQRDLARARDDLQAVNVSVTGKTLANVQATVGITQTHIALLGAVLLSLVPVCAMLGLGAMTDHVRSLSEVKTEKKPRRSPVELDKAA